MEKSFKRFLVVALYLILLAVPIIALFSGGEEEVEVGSGPNVVLRAMAIIVMLLLLMPTKGHFVRFNNDITRCILFLFFYVIVVSLFFNPTVQMAYALVRVLYPLLGFLCFFYLTKQKILDERLFSFFFLLLIVVLAVTTYFNLGNRMASTRELTSADNTGYALVCTYAGVMLLANRKAFPFALFLVIVGTLIAGKRGAIIAMTAATLPVLVFMFSSRQAKIGRRIFFIVLIAVGSYIALRYFSTYFDAAFGRFENLEEDGGSGREYVFESYWERFKYFSNFTNQLFGHGLYGSVYGKYSFTRFNAHNDWLELLFDFGIVGTIAYALVFIFMLKTIIQNRKNKNYYYYMLVMSFIIWFVKSIFSSTFLMDVSSIYLYMTAAYAIAKLEQGNQNYKIVKIIKSNDDQTTSSKRIYRIRHSQGKLLPFSNKNHRRKTQM